MTSYLTKRLSHSGLSLRCVVLLIPVLRLPHVRHAVPSHSTGKYTLPELRKLYANVLLPAPLSSRFSTYSTLCIYMTPGHITPKYSHQNWFMGCNSCDTLYEHQKVMEGTAVFSCCPDHWDNVKPQYNDPSRKKILVHLAH